MTNQHPITPPPDLLRHWEDLWFDEHENVDVLLATAFQAGYQQCHEEIMLHAMHSIVPQPYVEDDDND